MRIFTDGSVTGRRGGAAAVSDDGHLWSRFIKTHDAYFAELDAVLLACEKAEGQFSLVSDHVGIVNTIREMLDFNNWIPPKKAKEIWMQLYQYRDKIEGVEWMRRCSTTLLKMADTLAREASYER